MDYRELVFRDWVDNFAPKDFIVSDGNTTLIAEYIRDQRQGIVTASTLNAAVEALRSKLEFVPQQTVAEKAAKLEARMRKDFQDSLAPQTVVGISERNKQREAADKKAADEKELREINAQIDREISSHVKGHQSGHQDYAGTALEQDSLRLVAKIHNRTNIAGAKLALAAVQIAKRKL